MTLAYPLGQLRSEMAFIAYHFHWSHEEVMNLTHPERVEWVGQISHINQKIMKSFEKR
ncbi:MAG: DUF6760 family protein [Myxococcota bacterium]